MDNAHVGAILFSADHGNRNHQRGPQRSIDAKKAVSRLAELQSKVMVTAHQRPAHSDWGVNPFVRSPEVSNPQNCVYETSDDQAI